MQSVFSTEALLNFLQGYHRGSTAWSLQSRAGKNNRAHVASQPSSEMTEATVGVGYLAPASSGSNQVQHQMVLGVSEVACFDKTLGN